MDLGSVMDLGKPTGLSMIMFLMCFIMKDMERSILEDRQEDDVNALLWSMMAEPLDEWEDADLPSVLTYLRGSKSLNVPPVWRSILGLDK